MSWFVVGHGQSRETVATLAVYTDRHKDFLRSVLTASGAIGHERTNVRIVSINTVGAFIAGFMSEVPVVV